MKHFFVLCFGLFSLNAFAQVTDDFSDGNFSSNPSWQGDMTEFIVNANLQLQSNGPAATATLYLSTPSSTAVQAEWQCWVKLPFSPSSTNFARFYLISDQANLETPLNGYYIQMGEAGNDDSIDLFRQDGTTHTKIIDGILQHISASSNTFRIKVIRDNAGNWQLFSDLTGGNLFTLEGSATDNTYQTSSFTGIYVAHTATRNQSFYFDDIYAGPIIIDNTPPTLISAVPTSSTSLDILFSENLASPTDQILTNYTVNQGIGNPISIVKDVTTPQLYHLTFSIPFPDAVPCNILVTNVTDNALNSIGIPDNQNFTYYYPAVALPGDVRITEFMADPDPVVGLPNVEYVEIYNQSNKTLDVSGWKLGDNSTFGSFAPAILAPGQYFILCPSVSVSLFASFGTVIPITSFPSLNNTGDQIRIRNANAVTLDSIQYTDAWYKDAIKKNGGWSIERISVSHTCIDSANWRASIASIGGTPGQNNSVTNQFLDVLPPVIQSVVILSNNQIQVVFNEAIDTLTANNVAHYSLSTLGNPNTIQIQGNSLTLTWVGHMNNGQIYSLQITDIQDCIGNASGILQESIGIPEIVLSGDLVINEIHSDPDSVVGLPNYEFVEIKNISNKLLSLEGLTFSDPVSTAQLPPTLILPDSFIILCPSAAFNSYRIFGATVGLASFPSLNNYGDSLYLKDPSNQVISSLFYTSSWWRDPVKRNGGWTLERVSPTNLCADSANWRESMNPIGGTPGKENSILNQFTDIQPPIIKAVDLPNNHTVVIMCNEYLDPSVALQTNNYFLNNGLAYPISVQLETNKITLQWATTLQVGVLYELKINGLKDCIGNISNPMTLTIGIPEPVLPYDIRITEILPDPDPSVGLPHDEFIEIKNTSTKLLSLNGLTLSDPTQTVNLPSFLLLPDSLVIICSNTAAPAYQAFGTTIGLSSVPSLNNSSDSIWLKNGNIVISSVFYNTSWYRDRTKYDGGWSLELVDEHNPCSDSANWRASVAIIGGTPGKPNSVIGTPLETQPPTIISAQVMGTDSVFIRFSENISSTFLTSDFNIAGIGNPIQVFQNSTDAVILKFNQTFQLGILYTLYLSQVSDCIGNQSFNLSTVIGIAEPPIPSDLIFNEIYPDPDPSIGLPEAEFVELLNRSNKILSVKGLKLSDPKTQATLGETVLLPGEYLIVCPTASVNSFVTFGKTLGVSSFPSLNSTSDSLILRDSQGTVLDFIYYTDAWYGDNTKKNGGWTLERIDTANFCLEQPNWKASNDPSGGTPGRKNSIAGTVTDTQAPALPQVNVLGNTSIYVRFNEKIDPIFASNPANYQLNGLGNPILALLSNDNKSVTLTFSQTLDSNVVYTLTISQATDCSGNIAPTYAVEVMIPVTAQVGDIILSEILFNPATGGKRYVEVFNTSNNIISLEGWKIQRFTTSDSVFCPKIFLKPLQYLCLTADTLDIKSRYSPPDYACFAQLSKSLPAFNYTADEIRLIMPSGVVADAVRYSKTWHFQDLTSLDGVALEKLSFTQASQLASNWFSAAATVHYGTPGYANSQNNNPEAQENQLTIEPKVFSPDQDGFEDFTHISYHFRTPGCRIQVFIFDSEGRLVKTLLHATLIGTEPESILWDGTDDKNHTLTMGVYVVLMEVLEPESGKKKILKSSVVLAKRMN